MIYATYNLISSSENLYMMLNIHAVSCTCTYMYFLSLELFCTLSLSLFLVSEEDAANQPKLKPSHFTHSLVEEIPTLTPFEDEQLAVHRVSTPEIAPRKVHIHVCLIIS